MAYHARPVTPAVNNDQIINKRKPKRYRLLLCSTTALTAAVTAVCLLAPVTLAREINPNKEYAARFTTVSAAKAPQPKVAARTWHPPHRVKVWTTRHKGRIFRITQLPRCEHLETLISYNPSGETLQRAKKRLGGVAACTGSFHHPRSMALADFLQRDGNIYSPARTGRGFVAVHADGRFDISKDYAVVKGKPGVCALALGQRLVPFHRDGFSTAFMNRVTDRMAIGVNNNFIFIVQGKSDIWRLAHFMKHKLPVNAAINSDGGHVVRGKAPVHLVFRWKNQSKKPVMVADSASSTNTKRGGI